MSRSWWTLRTNRRRGIRVVCVRLGVAPLVGHHLMMNTRCRFWVWSAGRLFASATVAFLFFSFGCMSIIFFLHFSLIFFTFHRIVCSSWKPQRFPHFGSFVFNKTEKEEDILIYSLSLLPSLGSVVIRSNTRSKLFQFYWFFQVCVDHIWFHGLIFDFKEEDSDN